MTKDKQEKKIKSSEEITKRNRIIFIACVAGVLVFAAIYMMNYEPPSMAESFYESRKSVESYDEYQDMDSAKKKAERNVFLQD